MRRRPTRRCIRNYFDQPNARVVQCASRRSKCEGVRVGLRNRCQRKPDDGHRRLDEGDYFTASVAGSAPITLTGRRAGGFVVGDSIFRDAASRDCRGRHHDRARSRPRSSERAEVHRAFAAAPFTLTTTAPTSWSKRAPYIPVHLTPAPDASLSRSRRPAAASQTTTITTISPPPTIDEAGNGIINTEQIALTGSGTCEASLSFLSYSDSSGSVDSAFKGIALDLFGDAEGLQKRAITVTFTN